MTDHPNYDPIPAPLWRLTQREQIRAQSGPGTEGLPGFVVVHPGPGAWYFDDAAGEWKQEVEEGV